VTEHDFIEMKIMQQLVARRRAFTRVASFLEALAQERSELGAAAAELVEDVRLLAPYSY
jgi:hypothetical protein